MLYGLYEVLDDGVLGEKVEGHTNSVVDPETCEIDHDAKPAVGKVCSVFDSTSGSLIETSIIKEVYDEKTYDNALDILFTDGKKVYQWRAIET